MEKTNTSAAALQIFPIGGVEHVTQNMYLYTYEQEIMIVDCGIGFPDVQMPGVDILIPDISYLQQLLEQGKKIVGMVLSHGHDDHIAALPYLLPNLPDFPIYASKLTSGFASNRLLDAGNVHPITVISDRATVAIGQYFQVTPLAITHSVPDTKHFLITTPVGNVYHGSDFKLDAAPVDGVLPDYEFMSEIAKKGLKLMLTDCLGVEKPEWTGSESSVGEVLGQVMADVQGKVLVTLMSSHIHRIKQIMDAAARLKRKVALIGRSVEQNVLTAAELGFITDEQNVLINKKDIRHYPDHELVLIVAGSQGQEGSSLVRAIYGEHREIRITNEDRVIFSADAIPGNEISYYGAIDELCMNGVHTLYPAVLPGIHQSGHARRPELADLIQRLKPAKIFPIGGNNRHRAKYIELVAEPLGYHREDIVLPHEGDIISLFADGRVSKTGNVNLRPQIVDGLGIGDVGPVVLSDRRALGQAGIIIVLIKHYRDKKQAGRFKLDKNNLALDDITVVSRGFVFMKDAGDVIDFIKRRTKELIQGKYNPANRFQSERFIERGLARSLYEVIQREPMIEVEIITC
jgi:ribonuclease J